MLRIETSRGALDAASDFQITIEDKNPVMNDRGSQSVPATVPYTRRNAVISGYAHRLDIDTDPNSGDMKCVVSDGVYQRTGVLNVVSAGKTQGFTFNVGFDNSEAYAQWKAQRLCDLKGLPVQDFGSVAETVKHLVGVMKGQQADYACFQVVTSRPEKEGKYYPEYLNALSFEIDGFKSEDHPFMNPGSWVGVDYAIRYEKRTEKLLVDSTVTNVNMPEGYGVTPFIYVWRVLELLFDSLGYTIVANPFKEDPALRRLTVLNNVTDAICKGRIRYEDMMPTCTVEQFLQALYTRFGLVYYLSTDTRKADIRLIRDVLKGEGSMDMTDMLMDEPLVQYAAKKQLKLSASTSFEGAAPKAERYEEFARGRSEMIVPCAHFDEPKEGQLNHSLCYFEQSTGSWYLWDNDNRKFVTASSHFAWDRQTTGVDTEDQTGEDECLPMAYADNNILCPQYLAGTVHHNTYVVGASEDEHEEEDTPLAFAWAFMNPVNCYPFGSVMASNPFGEAVRWSNGDVHRQTLLMQFTDGLFAHYWKDFDAVLRHAYNSVEVPAGMPAAALMGLNLLDVVRMRGQRMMIDTINYSLPASSKVPADVVLRTLRLIGPYDLAAEQGIPSFTALEYEWAIESSTFNEVVDSYNISSVMNGQWVDASGPVGLTPEDDMATWPKPSYDSERITKTYKGWVEVSVWYWDYSINDDVVHEERYEFEYQVTFVPAAKFG